MLVFAHGLEGSPQGRKAQLLRTLGLPLQVPDLRGVALQGRYERIEALTRGGGVLLVGSSYGGLVAAMLAADFPERFLGVVLCAPALDWREPPNHCPEGLAAPAGLPVTILHGIHDRVVPIGVSRAYRDRSPPGVLLYEPDDDHGLGGSLPLLAKAVLDMVDGRGSAR